MPAFLPLYSGFVNGDTPASLTSLPVLTTTATDSSPVGTYPIHVSGAAATNYIIQYVDGTLTVLPAGTKGLRAYLMLTEGHRGIRIDRIKEKLGVRSMATGEVTLENAPAEEIGGFDPGVIAAESAKLQKFEWLFVQRTGRKLAIIRAS